MNDTRESDDFARIGLFLSTGGILYPSLYKRHRTAWPSHTTTTVLMGLFAATAGGASALQRAGNIAAIVGASVAVLLLAAGITRWWWRNHRVWSVQPRLCMSGQEIYLAIAGLPASTAQ